MQSLKTRRPPYRISVTDLLNLKQAYFRRKYPEIVPPLEKQQLMWAGTGFHKTFGSAVSSEEYLEQFVEAEGIVGKIDIYEKIPVEVKTTSTPVDTKDLLKYRPTYIEQLGMYCANLYRAIGHVLCYGQCPRGRNYHLSAPGRGIALSFSSGCLSRYFPGPGGNSRGNAAETRPPGASAHFQRSQQSPRLPLAQQAVRLLPGMRLRNHIGASIVRNS